MDLPSSPPLPTASLTSSWTYSLENNQNFAAKRQSRGRDIFDDSSSVTSMSSASKGKPCSVCQQGNCHACGNKELPMKPLIRCVRCNCIHHPYCHRPTIPNDAPRADFTCRRCMKKMDGASRPSPSVASPGYVNPVPTFSSTTPKEPERKNSGYACEIAGCKTVMYQKKATGRNLCKPHEVQERHKIASAMPAIKTAPSSKPFKKSKLYPVKPEDRQLLKRKRNSVSRRSISDDNGPSLLERSPQKIRPISRSVPDVPSTKSTPKPTPRERGAVLNLLASKTNHGDQEDDFNHSFGSASMVESSIDTGSPNFDSSNLLPDSARRTPQLPEEMRESPEYEPPPPHPVDDHVSPWAAVREPEASPGSQIREELRANANQYEAVNHSRTSAIPALRSTTFTSKGAQETLRLARSVPENRQDELHAEIRSQMRSLVPLSENDPRYPNGVSGINKLFGLLKENGGNIEKAMAEVFLDPIQPKDGNSRHTSATISSGPNQFPVLPGLVSRQEQERETNVQPVIEQHESDGSHAVMGDGGVLGQIDAPREDVPAEDRGVSNQPARASPALTTISSSTNTDDDLEADNMNIDLEREEDATPAPASEEEEPLVEHELDLSDPIPTPDPESIEACRAARAANYDSSSLDLFLAKQSEPKSLLYQPSSKELLDTQFWGHIDPRKVWPKEQSEEWYEAKKAEIKARGGRKANYGKVITAQNRKERLEKGWKIFQDKEFVETEEDREMVRHLEELTGVKDFTSLVPAVRNGVLCYVDPPPKDGKKPKGKERCFPVP